MRIINESLWGENIQNAFTLFNDSRLTAVGKIHGMCYGVVSIDAKRHQNVCRCICGHTLQKLYNLTRHIAGLPCDGKSPYDVH